MRMGPHVMLPPIPGSLAHDIYATWVTTVRPPVVKFCRQGFDPGLMDWTRELGTKIVGRWVEGEIDNPGGVLNELLQFANHLDYVEFANEESQGKDDPREWDRLMGKCLDFMQELDKRNRAAGRSGPKAVIANTSVGQPEVERWARESTLECARYADANGHRWGIHEYYKPEPWAMVVGGEAAWNGAAPATGWLMLRVTQAVAIMRQHGIGFRFIVTESGRDNIPGQPGPGGGFRDIPGEPFAERMAQYGRHLSALPCDGWVDYGFNAWDGWKQFDLTEDPAMAEEVIQTQSRLPRGGDNTGGSPMPTLNDALFAEAAARQRIRLNPTAAIQRAIMREGYVPTSDEFDVDHGGTGYVAQRAERLDSGEVRVFYCAKGAWADVRQAVK